MNVPRVYGNKSAIHRLHLKLCKTGPHARIFSEMIFRCCLDDKLDLSCCSIDTNDIPAKKVETDYDENKKIEKAKLSAITEIHGLPMLYLYILNIDIFF